MIFLRQALRDWGSECFGQTFKTEVEQLPASELPLQAGLLHSSAVAPEPFQVVVLSMEGRAQELWVKAGLFYSGIIAGCSCADDPTPEELQQEYCELEFVIDRATAEATVTLLAAE